LGALPPPIFDRLPQGIFGPKKTGGLVVGAVQLEELFDN
jgi:hypothetical protein